MRIAIISAVRSNWDSASRLLREIEAALANSSDLEVSTWLVDDGSHDRPTNWNSLAGRSAFLHVLELQGRQGQCRAISTALGYLICEREESFDAYVILDSERPEEARNLAVLAEASLHHPGAVIFGKVDSGTLPWRDRIAHTWHRLAARALCGESLENSSVTLLPARAAEALVHSSHAGSHLEAAVLRLKLLSISVPAARGGAGRPSSRALLEAASVFRERIFARIFSATSALCLLSFVLALALTALRLASPSSIPGAALALPWVIPFLLGSVATTALLLGLSNQSLNEVRRWTPALDCTLLVRQVRRVKRGPEAIAN